MTESNISNIESKILGKVLDMKNVVVSNREFTGVGWYLHGTITNGTGDRSVKPLATIDVSDLFNETTILMPTLFIKGGGKEFSLQVSVTNNKNEFNGEEFKKISGIDEINERIIIE